MSAYNHTYYQNPQEYHLTTVSFLCAVKCVMLGMTEIEFHTVWLHWLWQWSDTDQNDLTKNYMILVLSYFMVMYLKCCGCEAKNVSENYTTSICITQWCFYMHSSFNWSDLLHMEPSPNIIHMSSSQNL